MPYPKQNYFRRRTYPKGPRANNRINALEVQVINSDGKNLGVVATREAIELAKGQGLDLIEISPKANPPVCKIVDMGKPTADTLHALTRPKVLILCHPILVVFCEN